MTDNWTVEELAAQMKQNPDLAKANRGIETTPNGNGRGQAEKSLDFDVLKLKGMAEADFQVAVIRLLQENGFLVHAERVARSSKGWCTPVQGDAGYFDITAVHPVRHLFWLIELKSEKGKLSAEQEKWMLAASQCPGVKVMVLRPSDMESFREQMK